MVMSSTNAMELNIQAVSPELILSKPTSVGSVGAGAAAGAAGVAASAGAGCAVDAAELGASSAHVAGMENVSNPIRINRDSLVFNANLPNL